MLYCWRMWMIQWFRAGAYSVYKTHRLCVRTNLPSVESSVVSFKVLKLDPTFWVFKIISALKYGSRLVVRWESTGPKQKQIKTASLVAMVLWMLEPWWAIESQVCGVCFPYDTTWLVKLRRYKAKKKKKHLGGGETGDWWCLHIKPQV